MNKFISYASAAVLFGFTAIAGVTPAPAASTQATFCNANPNSKGCGDFVTQQREWNQSPYQGSYPGSYRGYYRDRYDGGFGNPAAALFGLALGAVNNGGDHVQACERTYRSYDVRSDTFLGYDGLRHACRV